MDSKDRQNSSPIIILLVDENPSFARKIQNYFKTFSDRSFEIIWKNTIEEALSIIHQQDNIDIILMDYSFSSSSTHGLDLCLAVNEQERQIPIVFLSSIHDVNLAVEAMKLGVEEFLLKEDLDRINLPHVLVGIVQRVQIHKQKQAVEKRLIMAENRTQAVHELVVTVCHEFNNPLAAVKISYDLLQRLLFSDEERRLFQRFEQNYQRIETEIKRLRDLNFERIDSIWSQMRNA